MGREYTPSIASFAACFASARRGSKSAAKSNAGSALKTEDMHLVLPHRVPYKSRLPDRRELATGESESDLDGSGVNTRSTLLIVERRELPCSTVHSTVSVRLRKNRAGLAQYSTAMRSTSPQALIRVDGRPVFSGLSPNSFRHHSVRSV